MPVRRVAFQDNMFLLQFLFLSMMCYSVWSKRPLKLTGLLKKSASLGSTVLGM